MSTVALLLLAWLLAVPAGVIGAALFFSRQRPNQRAVGARPAGLHLHSELRGRSLTRHGSRVRAGSRGMSRSELPPFRG